MPSKLKLQTMLASSAMLLYGRRKNEFFAGWLYFSGRNADRQSFFLHAVENFAASFNHIFSGKTILYSIVTWVV